MEANSIAAANAAAAAANAAAAAAAAASAQQFHLKWNNHSLNTLSSFQHLLDTNTLVDVSLTCSNGKTVAAHRMVLAACSEYFYRLFKDLPEKHPVIVFKDAGEEIVRDLLLFMYKGEVEVQEAHLNDFLKFADTLQVKGLSQSDREDASAKAAAAAANAAATSAAGNPPVSPVKSVASAAGTPPTVLPPGAMPPGVPAGPMSADMAKSYLAAAGLGKFPPMFPNLPNEPASATDLLNSLNSPNLYRALQRKYQNQLGGAGPKFPGDLAALGADASMLKQMPPFLKVAADLASFYPPPPSSVDNDNDSTHSADAPQARPLPASPPTSNAGTRAGTPLAACATPGSVLDVENGHHSDSAMDTSEGADVGSPARNNNNPLEALDDASSSAGTPTSLNLTTTTSTTVAGGAKPPRGAPKDAAGGKMMSSGRGSRLERMIAAEYKILSEFQDTSPPEVLPVMTPELMKSRRTHSLQLAIGEILHSRASVQSAATKYHIPRETLRRHYQRYLKAMGIQKPPQAAAGSKPETSSAAASTGTTATTTTNVGASAQNNNNAKGPAGVALPAGAQGEAGGNAGEDGPSANGGFSSLLDIGQAYGIWNNDLDGDFKSKMKDDAVRRAMTAAAAMAQVGAMHGIGGLPGAAAAAAAAAAAGQGPEQDKDEKDNKQLVIDEEDDEEIIEPGDDSEATVVASAKKEEAASASASSSSSDLEVADDNDNSKKSGSSANKESSSASPSSTPVPAQALAAAKPPMETTA